MLLAADVGGTKILLGLFEPASGRPRQLIVRTYPTAQFDDLSAVFDTFVQDVGRAGPIDAAVLGVAGPVVGNASRLTNVGWHVRADEIAARFSTRAQLVNDLEAMAEGAVVLTPDELVPLQEGVPREDGHAAVMAAGTGLGQAYLHRVDGAFRTLASEGGHADFAPRTDRQIELLRMLRADYGRAEVEHILSGPGLVNLHRFTHRARTCTAVVDLTPRNVSEAALAARCPDCVEALELFVEIFGAEAGNLALRAVATAGLYLGGGLTPKILPVLQNGAFLDAFRAKGAMTDLVSTIPVNVILNVDAGLLGAAVRARALSLA